MILLTYVPQVWEIYMYYIVNIICIIYYLVFIFLTIYVVNADLWNEKSFVTKHFDGLSKCNVNMFICLMPIIWLHIFMWTFGKECLLGYI